MKIEIERMEDKFILGFELFENYAIIHLPYYDIWIMSDKIYNELNDESVNGGYAGTTYHKEVE